jgi:hypothetical protein
MNCKENLLKIVLKLLRTLISNVIIKIMYVTFLGTILEDKWTLIKEINIMLEISFQGLQNEHLKWLIWSLFEKIDNSLNFWIWIVYWILHFLMISKVKLTSFVTIWDKSICVILNF